MTKLDTKIRNTSIALALLSLVLIGVIAAQQAQIQQSQRIDCAAYQERLARGLLYDRLIMSWRRDGSIDGDTRQNVVSAYEAQRDEVRRAAMVSKGACD